MTTMGGGSDGLRDNRGQYVFPKEELLQATYDRINYYARSIDNQFNVKQKLLNVKQYAVDHPVIALFGIVTICMCSVPIMFFMTFATVSVLITFMGFVFIEGFLLTFASIVLGGVLFVFGFLSIGVSTLIALAWVTVNSGQQVFVWLRQRFPWLPLPPCLAAKHPRDERPVEEVNGTVFEKED